MDRVKVRIRGIYATALTALLAERFVIVEPSQIVRSRLGLVPGEGPPDVLLQERPDRQGIILEGLQSAIAEVVGYLRERLPWAVFSCPALPPRPRKEGPLTKALALLARVEAEFPKPAKDFLDQVRARITFTLPGHHLLKALDPGRVDEAEAKGAMEEARELEKELIWAHYVPGKTVTLVHLKAGEGPIRQVGELQQATEGHVLVRRTFRPGGLYDGLGLPKEAGDHGYVELVAERWWSRRAYFRASGERIGEMYNIQTPPEFLPGEIRYLDLELDLVRVGEELQLLDQAILEKKVAEGLLSPALAEKAWQEAQGLWATLAASGPPAQGGPW